MLNNLFSQALCCPKLHTRNLLKKTSTWICPVLWQILTQRKKSCHQTPTPSPQHSQPTRSPTLPCCPSERRNMTGVNNLSYNLSVSPWIHQHLTLTGNIQLNCSVCRKSRIKCCPVVFWLFPSWIANVALECLECLNYDIFAIIYIYFLLLKAMKSWLAMCVTEPSQPLGS